MQLTIYRGTKEIGGNCVELCAGSTRLIIDVGMPLVDEGGEPFDTGRLRGKDIDQLLNEGILPKVPGLFGDGDPPDAILLSHAHADHTGLLKYTKPEIPVFLSKGTSKMMLAGSIFAGQQNVERKRANILEPRQQLQIGDFTITAYPVDHSAFDSMAFIVEADGKRVLYSGDLRLHGRKPGMAKRLIEATKEQPIDVMLMEGTHFGRDNEQRVTEHELEEQIVGYIRGAEGLVLAAFSPMHVDRLVTFYRAAGRTNRTFVVDPYAAFVMHLVSSQCHIPRPEERKGIKVYYNDNFEQSWQRRRLQKIHDMFAENRIDLEEIISNPESQVMVFRPSMVQPDFNDNLPNGTTCIYSYWPGYLKKPDWKNTKQSVEVSNGQFIEAHTSGHILAQDIVELVNAIGPRTIIPVHTFEPEAFETRFTNARRLDDEEPREV